MFTLNLSFNPLYVRLTEHCHYNTLPKQRTLHAMHIPTCMHAPEVFLAVPAGLQPESFRLHPVDAPVS